MYWIPYFITSYSPIFKHTENGIMYWIPYFITLYMMNSPMLTYSYNATIRSHEPTNYSEVNTIPGQILPVLFSIQNIWLLDLQPVCVANGIPSIC